MIDNRIYTLKIYKKGNMENTYAKERANTLFKELELLCPYGIKKRKQGTSTIVGYKNLAIREADLLMRTYPDSSEEEERTYTTAYRQIAHINNELKQLKKEGALKDHANKYSIDTLIKHITAELYSHFAVYRKRYNVRYRHTVLERSAVENRIVIDTQPYLVKADDVLRSIKSQKPAKWEDISIAIALTTGRRMAEVHQSAKFEIIDNYTLSFKGQLKGKTRKVGDKKLINTVFEIPTLVESSLIIDGIQYLEQNNKRIEADKPSSTVNNRFSRYLSTRIKTGWNFLNDSEEITYHKTRPFYFICASNNYQSNGDLLDATAHAQQILGDDDISTLKSYQRYKVKDGSLTRI